jgi:hypothetical protein
MDTLNISTLFMPESKPLIYDVIRTITIQIVTQLLFSISNPSVNFINKTFIQTTIYLTIGVCTFWMFVYKWLISTNL